MGQCKTLAPDNLNLNLTFKDYCKAKAKRKKKILYMTFAFRFLDSFLLFVKLGPLNQWE